MTRPYPLPPRMLPDMYGGRPTCGHCGSPQCWQGCAYGHESEGWVYVRLSGYIHREDLTPEQRRMVECDLCGGVASDHMPGCVGTADAPVLPAEDPEVQP